MFDFLKKHKFFLILLLALITLAVGMIFVVPSRETQKSEAGEYDYYYNFSAKWDNGNGSIRTGKYISQDGHIYDGAVGSVSISWIKSKGGSWSGSSYVDTMTGSASCKFHSSCTFWEGIETFDCELSRWTSTKDGFYSSISSDGTVGMSGKYGSLVWDSDTSFFHAVFRPRTYVVTYQGNGGVIGSAVSKSVNTTFYESYNLPASNPTREGYTFIGWYTEETGGTQIDSNTCFSDLNKRTLYAHWVANAYNVTFDRNGGSGGTSSMDVFYEQTPDSIILPERTGYSFLGYFTSTDGGTKYFDESGNAVRVWDIASNAVLYARWQVNVYTVSIDIGNAMIIDAKGWEKRERTLVKQIAFDTIYGDLPILSQTGFTLNGYKNGANSVTATTEMKTAYDHTLTIDWIEHAYTIKFDAGGGSGSMSDITGIKFTDKIVLPNCSFARDNYLFKGWALSSGGEIKYLENAYVERLSETNGNVVILYALWEETWANKAIKPSGKGTISSPYLIDSAENLAWLASLTNNNLGLEGFFKQTANIDLDGLVWLPIGNGIERKFIGVYDGNNFSIRNITTTQTKKANGEYLYSFSGLFGNLSFGTLKNINILSGNIYGNTYVGGIVGYATSAMTISSCQTYVGIEANAKAGGIAGYISNSKIEYCYSTATLNGTNEIGGIAGNINATTIDGCGFEGSFGGTSNIGLLVGKSNSGTIVDCYANVASSGNFYNGSVKILNCLYTAGTAKKYYDGTFSNWIISPLGKPIPSGLLWIAIGGEKISSVEQIIELGYTKI